MPNINPILLSAILWLAFFGIQHVTAEDLIWKAEWSTQGLADVKVTISGEPSLLCLPWHKGYKIKGIKLKRKLVLVTVGSNPISCTSDKCEFPNVEIIIPADYIDVENPLLEYYSLELEIDDCPEDLKSPVLNVDGANKSAWFG